MSFGSGGLLSRPTRIFFISSTEGAPWGGSEELWACVATEYRNQNCDVFASVKYWPQRAHRIQELQRIGVRFQFRGGPTSLLDRIIRPHALRRVRPDLVFVNNGGNLPPIELARKLIARSTPYINISHSNAAHLCPQPESIGLFREYFRNSLANCFVAQTHLKTLEYQIGMPIPNSAIVRNPVNLPPTSIWEPLGTRHMDQGARFAVVGRIDEFKGLDLVFEALSQARWRERKWQLSIFGQGPQEKNLAHMAPCRGIDDRVVFEGHADDISAVWLDNDLLILASSMEGLPLAILEAMLCGRPVVATDVGDIGRAVEEGVTGFLAAAPTFNSISDALERAWARRAEWSKMGIQARERAMALVPSNAGKEFIEGIAELVAQARSSAA